MGIALISRVRPHIGNQAGDGNGMYLCPILERVLTAGWNSLYPETVQTAVFLQTVRHASAAEQIGRRLIGK